MVPTTPVSTNPISIEARGWRRTSSERNAQRFFGGLPEASMPSLDHVGVAPTPIGPFDRSVGPCAQRAPKDQGRSARKVLGKTHAEDWRRARDSNPQRACAQADFKSAALPLRLALRVPKSRLLTIQRRGGWLLQLRSRRSFAEVLTVTARTRARVLGAPSARPPTSRSAPRCNPPSPSVTA